MLMVELDWVQMYSRHWPWGHELFLLVDQPFGDLPTRYQKWNYNIVSLVVKAIVIQGVPNFFLFFISLYNAVRLDLTIKSFKEKSFFFQSH